MGKYERRVQRKPSARTRGVEARADALKKNAKLAGVVDRAFRMPGSRRLRKH